MTLLITLHVVLCIYIFLYQFKVRSGAIELPSLVNFVYMGWVLPQLMGLWTIEITPKGALEKTVLFSLVCLFALQFGYYIRSSGFDFFNSELDFNKLLRYSIFYTIGGGFFYWKVNSMAGEIFEQYGGAWTGIITIYVFLGKMLTVGLIVSLLIYIKYGWTYAKYMCIFCLIFYFDRIFFYGRRAPLVELVMIFIYAFGLIRNQLIPRRYFVIIFMLGVFWINSIGDFRGKMLNDDLSFSGVNFDDLFSIDFIGNLVNIFNGLQEVEELSNLVYTIEAVSILGSYDFGFSLWNAFVFQYFPAQIFGGNAKAAIMFDLVDPVAVVYSYVKHTGTTTTGMADSFSSFGYFGWIKFFIIGYIFKGIYLSAKTGSFLAQSAVMMTVTAALHSVTHDTHHYFLSLIDYMIFFGPLKFLCKKN